MLSARGALDLHHLIIEVIDIPQLFSSPSLPTDNGDDVENLRTLVNSFMGNDSFEFVNDHRATLYPNFKC